MKILKITIRAQIEISADLGVDDELIVQIKEKGNIFGKDQQKLIEEFKLIEDPNYVPVKDIEILLASKIMQQCEGSISLDTKRSYTVIEITMPTQVTK